MADGTRVTALVLGIRLVLALAAFTTAQWWSERRWPAAGGMPVWLVVVTMAAMATLFAGTGHRLTRLAERIVLGDRAAGYAAGRSLLQRMATALPVEQVLPSLAEITGRTLQVDRSEVRVNLDGGRTLSQVWPERAGAQGSPVVVEVRHDGDAVGEIEADVARPAVANREATLLRQLAAPAGLAMSTVRLTVDLQRRAVALQRLTGQIAASNERIALARQQQAATITAEIRDRVDPCLRSARECIDRARAADAADPAAADLIDRARELVGQGLDELRDLARRIYPPRLGDGGLVAALEGWQMRSGVGLDLAITDDPRLRADPAVAAAVYFLVAAALTSRPGAGPRQSVSVHVAPDRVEVEVTRPAAAGAPAGDPTLAAMRDRVDAFGGDLTVTELDGRSTLRAWLPLERVA